MRWGGGRIWKTRRLGASYSCGQTFMLRLKGEFTSETPTPAGQVVAKCQSCKGFREKFLELPENKDRIFVYE